jgi:hypothetical protein
MEQGVESTLSPVGFQHLLGVFAGGLGQLGAAQHAGNFFSTFFSSDWPNRCLSSTGSLPLLDDVVMVGEGGDLRQMGHAEHLIILG